LHCVNTSLRVTEDSHLFLKNVLVSANLWVCPKSHTTPHCKRQLQDWMVQCCRILESFVIHARIKSVFAGIDATGFGHGQPSYYYTKRAKLRRKFVKMSAISDMKSQIICAIKIRHRTRHDSIDFIPLLQKANGIIPIGTVVADKGYDSERNHVESDSLGIVSIIPPRYENVPVYKTRGYHRKMLKRNGYDAAIYHQRNKTETIFSVIKKMFGENVTSRKISTQNRELFHRVIAYNAYRITRDNLLIWHGFYTANKI